MLPLCTAFAIAWTMLDPSGALAADKDTPASEAPPIAMPSILDPGGLRAALEAKGIKYQLTYIGEELSNISGGVRRGTVYDGRLELVLDTDLEKLMGWKGGALHANAYQIHGGLLTANQVGSLATMSNIEALPSTRLSEAWFEQKLFNDTVAIKLGQLDADTEFLISTYSTVFINGTFGWPTITSHNLPSGGPAYPFATPGIRVKFDPTPQYSLLLGVLNGDPAGPGTDDPQVRNPNGLNFRVNDPPLVIAEGQFKYNQEKAAKGLAGTIKLGAWTHFGQFSDLRFSTDGLSLADPLSNQLPLQHRYDHGVYAVIDQQLYRLASGGPDKGIGFFVRASASPSDRNLVDFYIDAGLNFAGMIQGRPDDTFGIAVSSARISDSAVSLDLDRVLFTGIPTPIRNYEALIEFTYQAQIMPGWTIQPDLQYVIRPGGNIANPFDPSGQQPVPNATVIGLRSTIKY